MKDFLIIGCGRFGRSVADALLKMDKYVAIMDIDEKLVQELSDKVSYSVQGNSTNPDTLASLGIENFDAIVIGIGNNVEASIMTIVNLKDLGAKRIVVKALNNIHAKILESVGADRVIFPERDMGIRIAHNLIATNLLDYIELSPDYSIIEVIALPEWEEKSLADLNFRFTYNANVVAIKSGDEIKLSLSGDDVIKKNDVLVVISHKMYLNKL